MSRRTRVFIGVFVVYLAAVGFMLTRVAADLDPRYRESAEESLVDTAHLLATLLERKAFDGIIPINDLERTLRELQERPLSARIFDFEKKKIDLHVYVTDREGIVLFDSRGVDLGADYAAWRDVALTLQGRYGARTTLADPADPKSAVMYVGAAIREDGRGGNGGGAANDDIIGMVAVGKPIAAIRPFIANAREKLVIAGMLSTAAFALALLLVIVWLVRPFGLLRDVWRAVRREGGAKAARRWRWRAAWPARCAPRSPKRATRWSAAATSTSTCRRWRTS
ncbi:MAG: hypothetical protein LW835_10955 [Burkholderiaceae bacterium]|jgi:two-component system sensor histidine kinase CreC|nr:hypothetical protein [Burkholderiaceae bacterium]